MPLGVLLRQDFYDEYHRYVISHDLQNFVFFAVLRLAIFYDFLSSCYSLFVFFFDWLM